MTGFRLAVLPELSLRENELSKCAFCPKLCRAACVVSEVEGREAFTPGNKMGSAFDVARGEPLTPDRAEQAFACSGCFRCREMCDHRNPVADTLADVRAAYVAQGRAPAGIEALLARETELETERALAHAELVRQSQPELRAGSGTALLLGCRYTRTFPREARAAVKFAAAIVGPLRLVDGCCGAWQRAAGAASRAAAARQRLVSSLHAGERLLVLDPRCALELRALGATTLVELATTHIERLGSLPRTSALRYHDNCALGRGLGLYDEPRALLRRISGRPPLELSTTREQARCSGGGALLPVSLPDTARGAAQLLAIDHERMGGGSLVTGCASSLSQMRRAGVAAVDLVTLLASSVDASVASGVEQAAHD